MKHCIGSESSKIAMSTEGKRVGEGGGVGGAEGEISVVDESGGNPGE